MKNDKEKPEYLTVDELCKFTSDEITKYKAVCGALCTGGFQELTPDQIETYKKSHVTAAIRYKLKEAPLSNETKVVESAYSRGENESLEDWKIRLDEICLTPEFKDCQRIIENQSPSCYPDIALLMLEYASQFKNTHAVRVINDRIAELWLLMNDMSNSWEMRSENSSRYYELNHILKLIQP